MEHRLKFNAKFTAEAAWRMLSTEAKAPFPISPQAKVFTCGEIICTQLVSRTFESLELSLFCRLKPWMVDSCVFVRGCSHIAVFIAGANKRGFPGRCPWPKSQARITQDTVSSQNPFAILARVWADKGATKRMSAQSRRSMWSTGSPSLFHSFHSSSARTILNPHNRLKFGYHCCWIRCYVIRVAEEVSSIEDCTLWPCSKSFLHPAWARYERQNPIRLSVEQQSPVLSQQQPTRWRHKEFWNGAVASRTVSSILQPLISAMCGSCLMSCFFLYSLIHTFFEVNFRDGSWSQITSWQVERSCYF